MSIFFLNASAACSERPCLESSFLCHKINNISYFLFYEIQVSKSYFEILDPFSVQVCAGAWT